jgi:hypothetical protein
MKGVDKMAEENNTKEVYFSEWCNKCKHAKDEEWKDPCNTCLAEPYNYDTHRPTKYEEAK